MLSYGGDRFIVPAVIAFMEMLLDPYDSVISILLMLIFLVVECVWLKSVIQHIRKDCDISTEKEAPTIMYKNDATCIKGVRTKHFLSKFFFTHEL